MKKDKWRFKKDWVEFYPHFSSFSFMFGPASYFDSRWYGHFFISQLLALILMFVSPWFGLLFFIPWGEAYVHFPFRSKWDECDPPQYGFNYHSNSLWIHWGDCEQRQKEHRYYVIYMPWDYTWIRTSKLKKDAIISNPIGPSDAKANYKDWFHETKGNRIDFYKKEMKDVLWKEVHPYSYTLRSGTVQNCLATICIEEREWRMKWLKWTKLLNKVRREIAIEFSAEVGEGTSSWKGGTVGCGYNLHPNETPEQCLRRMEIERKFDR